MGVMGQIFGVLFGSGRNVIAETAQVFRENAEAGAVRAGEHQTGVTAQFAGEFAQPRVGLFDQVIDGLNRLPRPFMAFGVLGLFTMAMVDPVWFAQRMVGISLVPEPLWWLMGAIVSFYFGARYQAQGERFQREIAGTLARAPLVVSQIEALEGLRAPAAPQAPRVGGDDMPEDDRATGAPDDNPALADWQQSLGDTLGQPHASRTP